MAERWALDAAVSAQATRSSNVLFETAGPKVADTVLTSTAGLAIRGEGARLKLGGTAGLTAVGYVDHTIGKQLLPQADLSARLEAIDELAFLEAGYRAAQTSADPFGPRPEITGGISNVRTTTQWRFTPSLQSTVGGDLNWRIRSDNTWTREIGSESALRVPGAGGYFGRHVALIERDPLPFGWRVEAERTDTRYDNSTIDPVTTDLFRGTLRYRAGADVVLAVRAGSERNGFLLPADRNRFTWGVDAQWRPSERTSLSVAADDRFFGHSWDARLGHRQPRWAMNASLSRIVDTTPQSVLELPASNDVAALLDAMLATRFPDPLQRLKAVQDVIAQQGLPGSTISPTVLYAQRLSVVTTQRVNLAFNGVRTTVALAVYAVRTRDALDSGPFALGLQVNNNNQRGAAVAFGHRLSALTSANVGADWSSVRALESISPAATRQRSAHVQLGVQLAPKTSAYVGARVRQLDSSVVNNGNERAIFAGANHRF